MPRGPDLMPPSPKGERLRNDVIGTAVMVGKIATGEIDDMTTDGKNGLPWREALGRQGQGCRSYIDAFGGCQEGRCQALETVKLQTMRQCERRSCAERLEF